MTAKPAGNAALVVSAEYGWANQQMKKYTFFEIFVIAVSWAVKGRRTRFDRFRHPGYRDVPSDSSFLNSESYQDDLPRLIGKHSRPFRTARFLQGEMATLAVLKLRNSARI
jgi:hypothetical protein